MTKRALRRSEQRSTGGGAPLSTVPIGVDDPRTLVARICCVVAILLARTLCAAADWPSFRGNPQMTGVAESVLPEQPELLWTFNAADAVESTAAIVDGVAYVGSVDGNLYAIYLSDGSEKWRFAAAGPVKSSPTVHNGAVYFGDEAGVFHAVDAAFADELWRYEAEGEVYSGATVVENRVIFGSYDQFLYGLAVEDGAEMWKAETESYVHGSPSVSKHGVIIAGCDGFLRAINPSDGAERLTINLEDYVGASAALADGVAYVGTYGNRVMAVDLDNSDVVWRYEHPVRHFPFYASGAIKDGVFVIGGQDKLIHAIDRKTGEPRWTRPAGSKVDSSPVIVGERVFFGTDAGEIVALHLADGALMWEYETGSAMVASPSVASDKLVIGSLDGVIYCFGKKTDHE